MGSPTRCTAAIVASWEDADRHGHDARAAPRPHTPPCQTRLVQSGSLHVQEQKRVWRRTPSRALWPATVGGKRAVPRVFACTTRSSVGGAPMARHRWGDAQRHRQCLCAANCDTLSDRRRGRGRRELTSFPSCLGTSGRTRRGERKGRGRTPTSPSHSSQGHGNALPPPEKRMARGRSLPCVRQPYGRWRQKWPRCRARTRSAHHWHRS